jgi:hypothetical protein
MASTNAVTRSLSLPPRAVEAVWREVERLGANDPKRVATALVEMAVEEAQRNDRFSERVRVLYDSLASAKAPARANNRQPRAALMKLVPVKEIPGRRIDISASPDPYFLHELFGDNQLPIALSEFSVSGLQEAVEIVQERNPGTKPKGKTKKAPVEYIVQNGNRK